MGAAILRAVFRYLAVVRFQQPPQLSAGKSGGRFVLIAPPEASLIRGVLSSPAAAMKPAPVGAVWQPAPVSPESTDPNLKYRLASDKNPFPAAVQDLFTTYQYVLDLGVASRDIVVMGDSAGANLVLALLRYLAKHGLPQPGGATAFSPWVEVTSEAVQRYNQSTARGYDILDVPLLEWALEVYRPRGKTLKAEEEAYVSPLNHPFRL
ncbi:hypothetical protein JX265_005603 [Neoarthrinium moseri]|uniref:Alpha/beta hydrolase fold-3 domain-containing protein n=1 Tax=Neoarthrinium moseri TaxID=1658444 RepID=A0A9Q0AME4_9PEZI|nr:hypothetical protein JX265_005603 [Neoarthrinium moseri]